VDINEELLAHARERASEIEFVAQDMCELDLGDARFDAVTCLFDSIGYPRSNERVIAALAGAGRHLAGGGVLAVEFLHAPAMLVHAAPLRVRRWNTEDGGELLRVSEIRLDVPRQVMEVEYDLVDLKPDGTYERWSEQQSNRFFSVEEMSALMGAAGLIPIKSVPAYETSGEIEAATFHVLALARVADAR
jgi:SAM-dependent methyltransferase